MNEDGMNADPDEPKWTPVDEVLEHLDIAIPERAMRSLSRIANAKDMSPEALVRLYISRGLRIDNERRFAERALSSVETELRELLKSDDDVIAAMNSIRARISA